MVVRLCVNRDFYACMYLAGGGGCLRVCVCVFVRQCVCVYVCVCVYKNESQLQQ